MALPAASVASGPGGQQSIILLADTFPAKAHLLISQLSETNPDIASFSPDGNSFFVFDQVTFAQEYLPKYFKHSNWGSFVRQLNLYGFTSSRPEGNSEVVIWTHELFRRGRNDLLDQIKRSKKPKSTPKSSPSPSNSNSDPRVESSLFSEGGSSNGAASQDERFHDSSNSTRTSPPPPVDQEWMASQFANLKQQYMSIRQHNLFLEQKLDVLLKLTLSASQVNLDDAQVGEKRQRVRKSGSNSKPWRSVSSHHELDPIYENQKMPFNDNQDGQVRGSFHSAGRMMFNESEEKSSEDDFSGKEDSFKTFIDSMLSGNGRGERRGSDERVAANYPGRNMPNMVPLDGSDRDGEYSYRQRPNNAGNGNSPSPVNNNQMVTSLNRSISDSNAGYGPTFPGAPQVNSEAGYSGAPGREWVTTANFSIDKASGPEPIPVVAQDAPDIAKDVEAGGATLGVTVVPAHAVEDKEPLVNEAKSQSEEEPQDDNKPRRHIFLLLALAVVVMAVVIPCVILLPNKNNEEPLAQLEQSDSRIIPTTQPTDGRPRPRPPQNNPDQTGPLGPGLGPGFGQNIPRNDDDDSIRSRARVFDTFSASQGSIFNRSDTRDGEFPELDLPGGSTPQIGTLMVTVSGEECYCSQGT